MKKIFLAAILAVVPFVLGAQNRADRQEKTVPGSSTLILFGDPQGYVKYDINQPIFELTTLWVADNVEHLNIKAVLCTGDLVEQNENNALNRNMLNQSSVQMWESISRSLERIDGKVPFIACGGNHDYGFRHSENYNTEYPRYISFERNSSYVDCLKAEYPNRLGHASLENAARYFNATPPVAGILLGAGLAMEEMAGNVVEHGFSKDSKSHTVDVRVTHKGDDVILRIKDDCIPFSPAEQQKLAEKEDITSNIGIRMVFRTASDIQYQNILGLNVLTIRI